MKEIIEAYRTCLKFEGRSNVRQFLYYQIFYLTVSIMIFWLDKDSGFNEKTGEPDIGVWLWIFLILNILPNLALHVRRLHDINHNGWWFLLIFIPYGGPLVLLIRTLTPGSKGENRFGPPVGKKDCKEAGPRADHEPVQNTPQ